MGDITMDPSDTAVYWVLISCVSMCPPVIDIITKTMSDLGLGMTSIKDTLPNVNLTAAFTWHIMVIDFTKNLKHIPAYDSCKKYVYDHLVKNTVSKTEWESNMDHACK